MKQTAAERLELMTAACAHLTTDELRAGVVSRRNLEALAMAVQVAIGYIEDGSPSPCYHYVICELRRALSAYRQEIARATPTTPPSAASNETE